MVAIRFRAIEKVIDGRATFGIRETIGRKGKSNLGTGETLGST